MHLQNLIALIDDELDRLQQARQILATLTVAPSPETFVMPATPPDTGSVAAAAIPSLPEIAPPPVTVASLKPSAPRRSPVRASRPRTPAAETPRALGRPANERPVFVSAELLSARSAAALAKAAAEEKPTAKVLTAEALAQRWIANSPLN